MRSGASGDSTTKLPSAECGSGLEESRHPDTVFAVNATSRRLEVNLDGRQTCARARAQVSTRRREHALHKFAAEGLGLLASFTTLKNFSGTPLPPPLLVVNHRTATRGMTWIIRTCDDTSLIERLFWEMRALRSMPRLFPFHLRLQHLQLTFRNLEENVGR